MSEEERQEARKKGGIANQSPEITACLLYGSTWEHKSLPGIEVPIEPGQVDYLIGLAEHLNHALIKIKKGGTQAMTIKKTRNLSLVIRGEKQVRYGCPWLLLSGAAKGVL